MSETVQWDKLSKGELKEFASEGRDIDTERILLFHKKGVPRVLHVLLMDAINSVVSGTEDDPLIIAEIQRRQEEGQEPEALLFFRYRKDPRDRDFGRVTLDQAIRDVDTWLTSVGATELLPSPPER